MSNYTPITNFTAKDALASGDPEKIISGADVDGEFSAIQTAIASKANSASPSFTGTAVFTNLKGATGATVTTILDEDTMSSDSATALVTQQSAKAYADSVGYAASAVLVDLNTLGAPTTDGEFIVATGAGAFAYESGATARTSLGLTIGTDVQAYSAVLDDLDTLGASTADGEFLVATGAGALAWESGATARNSLSLGTSNNVTFNTVSDADGEVRNLPTPDASDTGAYVFDADDANRLRQANSGASYTLNNSVFAADDWTAVVNKSGGAVVVTCSITTADRDGLDVATVTVGDDGIVVFQFQSATACTIFGRNLS